ncbi:MAG: lipoprotein [Pseudomonadota bacterium]
MKTLAFLLALTFLLTQLAACGSKGPLTLPEQKPADTQKSSK